MTKQEQFDFANEKLKHAWLVFNNAEPEEIDVAIYELKAAEMRLNNLVSSLKQ